MAENVNDGERKRKITADAVITKLKDDGDFDQLRLKIIRKLKQDEELRNNIISMVKESAALNRPGTENMKPRQLSDAIHQEVGDKVMSQISDSLWKIIRSPDGIRTEITETVECVYNKLSNPNGNGYGGDSSSGKDLPSVPEEIVNNEGVATSSNEIDNKLSDDEPDGPPGFTLPNHHQNNQKSSLEEREDPRMPPRNDGNATEERIEESNHSQCIAGVTNNMDPGGPPGFSVALEHQQPCDASDDDPDVPPGFG